MAEKPKKNLLKSFQNLPPCFFLRENRPLNFFLLPLKFSPKTGLAFLSSFSLHGRGGLGRPHEKRILGKSTRQSLSLFKRDRPTVPRFHLFFFSVSLFFLLEPRLSSFTFWDENADFYIFLCWFFSPFSRGAKVRGAVCNLIISPWKRQWQRGKKETKGPNQVFE